MKTKLTARDVMTDTVKSLSSTLTIDQAAKCLADYGISGAPVVNEQGKLVGVLSMTDVARAVADPSLFEGSGYYLRDPEPGASINVPKEGAQRTVADIMTPMIFEVDAEANVIEVAETMRKGRIHRVFVMDRGALVGVVSALDLLGVLLDH